MYAMYAMHECDAWCSVWMWCIMQCICIMYALHECDALCDVCMQCMNVMHHAVYECDASCMQCMNVMHYAVYVCDACNAWMWCMMQCMYVMHALHVCIGLESFPWGYISFRLILLFRVDSWQLGSESWDSNSISVVSFASIESILSFWNVLSNSWAIAELEVIAGLQTDTIIRIQVDI
jgi:hypothetical protein